MMPMWNPEYVVTKEIGRKLIGEQFPELAPVSLRPLGEGFDNTVYEVNEQFVFRFPRREIAVRLLQTEGRILPFLVSVLPLPIPEPIYFGKANPDYKWPYIGYRKVKGVTADRLTLPQRKGMTDLLAAFLRALHSFPVAKAQSVGVSYDELERLNIEKRKSLLEEQVKQIEALHLYKDMNALQTYALHVDSYKYEGRETLVHGDLHIRNIVVDEQGRLSGVIDWGDVHIGNPAIDLAGVYSILPPESRKDFYSIYGEVEKEEKELARFRAVFTNTVLLLYGYDKKDTSLVKLAQDSLEIVLAKDV
jgi:aminoglycoside phosphotransferase (APT) family kinase protein